MKALDVVWHKRKERGGVVEGKFAWMQRQCSRIISTSLEEKREVRGSERSEEMMGWGQEREGLGVGFVREPSKSA